MYMIVSVGVFISILLASVSGELVSISLADQERLRAQEELKCLLKPKANTTAENGTFCDMVWDTIYCWPRTPAGETVIVPCPNYVDKFYDEEFASRTCTKNGSWFVHPVHKKEWSDYTSCLKPKTVNKKHKLIAEHMPHITLMYTIGYGCSLVSLVVAVIIITYFRKLRCPRNTIHINLFISFILRASISFLKEHMLVEGLGFQGDVRNTPQGNIEFILEGTHWGCKLFFTFFHYLLATNYMWILVEGLYLHMLISWTQFSEKGSLVWFMLFGWVSPLLFVVPWIIVRVKFEDLFCWNTNPTPGYFWIMKGPIVASVVVNFIIFLSIIRILFIKLNAFNTFEAKKFRYRKLAKSTLVLIPLFGVHYIILLGVPDDVGDTAELVKLYFEMFFNSIQGLLVSLLFCFFNGEVQAEIRKKWNRYRLSRIAGNGLRRKSTRDTITSYLSRTRRGSWVSNSNSGDSGKDNAHQNGNCLPHSNGIHNKNDKKCCLTNGHVINKSLTQEKEPMIDMTSPVSNGHVVNNGEGSDVNAVHTSLL